MILGTGPYSAQIERAIRAVLSGGSTANTTFTGSVTATRYLASAGTEALPAFSTSGDPDTGWYPLSSGGTAYTADNSTRLLLTATEVRLRPTQFLSWTSGTITAARDTGLSRVSAGVVGVGTGTDGSVAGTIRAAAYTVGATAGASFSGAITNLTCVNGIVTAAS